MKVIALEEHFVTAEVLHAWQSLDSEWEDLALSPSSGGESERRLLDSGAERLAAMDEAGVDVEVLSLTTPGVQDLDPDQAVELARSTNNSQ